MPVLVAQAGHEGRTSGKTGTAGEQVRVKRVRDRIAATAPPGWTVRCIDADEPDASYRGDVFLSVHCDGSIYPSARGASVGYPTPEGGALAAKWKAAYSALGWPGGWHADNWTPGLKGYYAWAQCLRVGTRAAFLIELGTTTNASDAAWIDAHTDDIVASVWTAIAGAPGGSDMIPDFPTVGFIGLHRLHKGTDYVLAVSKEQIESARKYGYEYDGVFDLAPGGTVPLHQYTRNGYHIYQPTSPGGDWKDEGVLVHVHPVGSGATIYRLWSGAGHLYSGSQTEGAPTWRLDGPAFGLGTLTPPAPSDANEQIAKLEAELDKTAELARQILAVTA